MLCTSPSRAALPGEDAAEPRAAGSQAGKEVTRDWHPGLSERRTGTLRAAQQPARGKTSCFRVEM